MYGRSTLFGKGVSKGKGMSVQAGIWNCDGQPVDRKLLAKISQSLKQRCPDGESWHVDGSIAFLYSPFHTTCESRRERQPYYSARGFVFTWDGRLDNREEITTDLGCKLDDLTDIAIVSAAFDRWGTNCFQRVVGDWAVSIWQPQQRELILAADYMAIRHIFYYLKKARIWWSTELAPLVLLSGEKLHLDDDYIAGYFANEPESHLTPYREIREVPAGQFVRLGISGKVCVHRYWSFNPKSRIQYKTDLQYEEHFHQVFRQAVRRRLRSDSPILGELSGGLDSSSIVCVADDILVKEGAQAPRLDTLSYYDKTEPNADDWIYFEKIEQKRGRIGIHIDSSKLATNAASFEYSDFTPLPGYLAYGRHLESERAEVVDQGNYRVILSGMGGDELLGGIPNPSPHLADLIVQLKVLPLARQLIAWSLVKRSPWPHLLSQSFLNLLPAAFGQYLIKQARIETWIRKDFAKRSSLAIRQLDVQEHFGFLLPSRRSSITSVVLMGNKMANCTSSSTETRYPYLDRSLVEFILSIPATQLLRPGQRRSLMRRALVNIVPEEILSRRTKQFTTRTPVVALENNWQELLDAFDSSLCSRLGYIDEVHFLNSLQAARSGKSVHLIRLLKTIALEFWLRELASRHLLEIESQPEPSCAATSVRVNV